MQLLPSIFFLIAGLIVLVYSSNWLIQGSVKLSFLFKLTPLFIGAVVVAFGTSAPEAGVGIMAALRNQKAIALGNIIGSNIANIGLIMGLCVFFRPMNIDKSVFKREGPFMLFSAVLLYVLSWDLVLNYIDGIVFIACFLVFCLMSYRQAKKSFDSSQLKAFTLKKRLQNTDSCLLALGVVLLSLIGVVLGADLMVKGGVAVAGIFGISPWIIGIVVFAVGTSLPELAASLTASVKKVPSISAGNILGSNIFNILLVLGVVSLIRPINIEPSVLSFEMPVLLAFSFAFFIIMRTGYRISRREGLLIFSGYMAFITALVFKHL